MWNYLLKLYSVISGIWYGLKIVNFLPVSCSPGLLSHCGGFACLFSLPAHLAPEAVSDPFVLPGTVEASPPANSS